MAMTKAEKEAIKLLIIECLRRKFKTYKPKKKRVMPFHTRLLGKDRMALFSFIQSLNTTFGTVIYEPVAEKLAMGNFKEVVRGKKSESIISKGAKRVIEKIKDDLEQTKINPNQKAEVEKIRKVCRTGGSVSIKLRKADIYLVKRNNWHYPIDIKTVKPNVDGFEKYKENILKWTASVLYQHPKANVGAMLALPYNPDHPGPYKHWTMRGMVEKNTQIKVGEQFWNFLAGKPVYDDLLDCFERAGIEMCDEIDEYFEQFRGNN